MIKKRVFIGLTGLGLLILAGAVFGAWYLATAEPTALSRVVLVVFYVGGAVLVPLGLLGFAALVLTLLTNRKLPFFGRTVRKVLDLLYPVARILGRLLRIPSESIDSSFVAVNNRLVETDLGSLEPGGVLVLLPHCLQRDKCRYKITVDIENCRRCGLCPIADLVVLHEELKVRFFVASGGTQARRVVKDHRPRAIVAVGCEREIAAGIQDVGVIPVLGVINERPNGPCFNTLVDVGEVKRRLIELLKGGE